MNFVCFSKQKASVSLYILNQPVIVTGRLCVFLHAESFFLIQMNLAH